MAEDHDTHRPEAAGAVASVSQTLEHAAGPPSGAAPPPGEPAPAPAIQPADDDARPCPDFETEAERDAYWRGMTHGIRVGGGAQQDETRKLRWRTDGWTPERQRGFLIVLSAIGSVTEACAEVGLSRESAYRLRRKPEGRLFARLWDAARLIARDRLADEAMERAINGTTEAVFYRGEEIAKRRHLDNRHLQWTLGRLDRETGKYDDQAAPARRAAQAFDALVDKLDSDPAEAAEMLAVIDEQAGPADARIESEEALVARFKEAHELRRIEETDPADIDISDLDPEQSEAWTDLDWARAERSGLFDRLEKEGFWDDPEQPGDEAAPAGPD